MVIGNGLVARGFKEFFTKNECLVFASGVSNSFNTNCDLFLREADLLKQMLQAYKNKTFIYFGSCSVYDFSLKHSLYVTHKLEMESLVKQHNDYLIFRISNLVGRTHNANTFLNYFVQHIQSGNYFQLWKNASRNIIDIDDAVAVCTHILRKRIFKNEIINIANPLSYPVIEIVEAIEKFIKKKGIYEVVDKGGNPVIDIHHIQPLIGILGINFSQDYLNRMLQKYF